MGPGETEPGGQAEAQAELDLSIERVAAGGIPLSAERRLSELSERGGAFTSDLSVAGFALCHRLGLRPVTQVIGSSIYQVGYQPATYPMMLSGSVMSELGVLSEAWNEVRRRAFSRLAQEAGHAKADAVVGVKVRTGSHDFAAESIEYVITGTAVRSQGARAGAGVVLTELSVADYAKLLDAGYEAVGIVAHTAVFFAAYGNNWVTEPQMLSSTQNFEYREFTAGVYSAREQVMGVISRQASELGAAGIVGVRIAHRVRRQGVGSGAAQRGGVMITFDAIGTAIREASTPRHGPPKATIDLSS
jgi:uncharacterized protein YbjQ (UPF0145 family)